MAKHTSSETLEEMLIAESSAQLIADALSHYAKHLRTVAEAHIDSHDFTAASFYNDNAEAADSLAGRFEAEYAASAFERMDMTRPLDRAADDAILAMSLESGDSDEPF